MKADRTVRILGSGFFFFFLRSLADLKGGILIRISWLILILYSRIRSFFFFRIPGSFFFSSDLWPIWKVALIWIFGLILIIDSQIGSFFFSFALWPIWELQFDSEIRTDTDNFISLFLHNLLFAGAFVCDLIWYDLVFAFQLRFLLQFCHIDKILKIFSVGWRFSI